MWINLVFEERVHTLPLDDTKEHVVNGECWCGAAYDPEYNTVTHNSDDNREAFERGERSPS